MSKNIVKLETAGNSSVIRKLMSDEEFSEFKEVSEHPTTIGHILFDQEAEVLDAANVADDNAAALANVFDICDSLKDGFGQKEHISTVFEGRNMEITCRRLSEARLVVFRAKGNRKVGG